METLKADKEELHENIIQLQENMEILKADKVNLNPL